MGSTVRRKWQVICVWARSFKELSKRSLGLIIFTLLLDSEKVDTSIGKSKVKESLLSQGVGMGALCFTPLAGENTCLWQQFSG